MSPGAKLRQLKPALAVLEVLAPNAVQEQAALRGELLDLVAPYLPSAFQAVERLGYQAPTDQIVASVRQAWPDADPVLLAEAIDGATALYAMFDQSDVPEDERQQFLRIALREAGGA